MAVRRSVAFLALTALLAGCGGGDGGSSGATATGGSPTTGTPTTTVAAGCTLRERQDWVAAQVREWYLFPDTLPASLDPTPYGSVDTFLDALTATAAEAGWSDAAAGAETGSSRSARATSPNTSTAGFARRWVSASAIAVPSVVRIVR